MSRGLNGALRANAKWRNHATFRRVLRLLLSPMDSYGPEMADTWATWAGPCKATPGSSERLKRIVRARLAALYGRRRFDDRPAPCGRIRRPDEPHRGMIGGGT